MDLESIQRSPCVREARHYEKREDNSVQCGVCERRCKIKNGKRGYCGARINFDGRLYVLTYGDISSINANPIEKKPFAHFHPGTNALTIGGWGCNAACPWCQNWSISKRHPNPNRCDYLSPERFVEEIPRRGCHGTSYSFSEPTTVFFEYSLDAMPKTRAAGYYSTYVTNGYMTTDTLERLAEAGLDAMNIDIKGCHDEILRYCGLEMEKIWRNAQLARDLGIWVEITTLVIPGVNDTTKCLSTIADRICNDLGSDVPWHVSGFRPAYKSEEYGLTTPTPLKTLETAHSIGQKAGLHYVYIGNVWNHPAENTYCKNPSCRALLVKRIGYDIHLVGLTPTGHCSKCQTPNHFIMPPS
ncbi:MAG: AmmeMemoRadiSam system radical SAM enzyme [Promethearchaeota archaeon]